MQDTNMAALPPRICIVCDTTAPHRFRLEAPKDTRCQHPIKTCSVCWEDWIKQSLHSDHPSRISCAQCTMILRPQEIRAFATEHTYQRFLNAQFRATLAKMTDFYYCIMPGCESGQIHEGAEEEPLLCCVECGVYQCIFCQSREHPDQTCEEHQREREENRKTGEGLHEAEKEEACQKTIEETSKKCPACKSNIEKDEGCDHMTCGQCDYEFCWVCLGDYLSDQHTEDCKYYQVLDEAEDEEQDGRDDNIQEGEGMEIDDEFYFSDEEPPAGIRMARDVDFARAVHEGYVQYEGAQED